MRKVNDGTDGHKKVRFFLVFWPNGEQNLAIAETEEDLFILLDREGNPLRAEIYEVDPQRLGMVLLKVTSSLPGEIPVERFIRFTEDNVEEVYERILPGAQ